MELYKVIAKDSRGNIVQITDLHKKERCCEIAKELEERDDVNTIIIEYVGWWEE